jgi:hypothetical protein
MAQVGALYTLLKVAFLALCEKEHKSLRAVAKEPNQFPSGCPTLKTSKSLPFFGDLFWNGEHRPFFSVFVFFESVVPWFLKGDSRLPANGAGRWNDTRFLFLFSLFLFFPSDEFG